MLFYILSRHFAIINVNLIADFCFAERGLRGNKRPVLERMCLHRQEKMAHFKTVHIFLFLQENHLD